MQTYMKTKISMLMVMWLLASPAIAVDTFTQCRTTMMEELFPELIEASRKEVAEPKHSAHQKVVLTAALDPDGQDANTLADEVNETPETLIKHTPGQDATNTKSMPEYTETAMHLVEAPHVPPVSFTFEKGSLRDNLDKFIKQHMPDHEANWDKYEANWEWARDITFTESDWEDPFRLLERVTVDYGIDIIHKGGVISFIWLDRGVR